MKWPEDGLICVTSKINHDGNFYCQFLLYPLDSRDSDLPEDAFFLLTSDQSPHPSWRPVWVLFDESNGDLGNTKGYLWMNDTFQQAEGLHLVHSSSFDLSNLSKPLMFLRPPSPEEFVAWEAGALTSERTPPSAPRKRL